MNADRIVKTDIGTYWVEFDARVRYNRKADERQPEVDIIRVESLTSDEDLSSNREVVKACEAEIIGGKVENMAEVWDAAENEFEEVFC